MRTRGARGALLPRSAYVLLVANVVPLLGVLGLGWDLGLIMLLFWAENAVIGVLHALRIALVTGRLAFFLVPFFSFHYGMFTLVHGLFVAFLFVLPAAPDPAALARDAALPLVALAASHAWSFWANFVKGGEMRRMREAGASLRFRQTGPNSWSADVAPADGSSHAQGFHELGGLMTTPYRRVFVMHLTILGGGFLILWLGAPVLALVLLVVLKTAFDLRAHLQERRRLQGQAPAAPF